MECYKTYGTPEALKRHVRYAHNTSTVRCRWCPYEVSSNVRFRMKDHEKKQHWYKYHTETAAPLRTSNHHHNNKKDKNQKIEPKADKKEKIKSVVTSNGSSKSSKEKQSKSTSSTTAKGASTTSEKENLKPLSPLREPSPFDLEFEGMMSTNMLSLEEETLFKEIERTIKGVVEEKTLKDSESHVKEQAQPDVQEIQEIEEVIEVVVEERSTDVQPTIITTEIDAMQVDTENQQQESRQVEDNRIVIIDGMKPTPEFIPRGLSIVQKPYGRVYDYRHYDLPTPNMEDDPRDVLLAPPSSYNETAEGKFMNRIRERARRHGCETKTIPDGYSGIIKTERCELPDGTLYSLTSHWVPSIPLKKFRHFGQQYCPETRDTENQVDIKPERRDATTQSEDTRRVVLKQDSEAQCEIISCRFY